MTRFLKGINKKAFLKGINKKAYLNTVYQHTAAKPPKPKPDLMLLSVQDLIKLRELDVHDQLIA